MVTMIPIIGNAAASVPTVFDGASYAFSLRKLYPHYSGNCIRIRDSVTTSETDIGFDGGGLVDTAAILSHVGSNDAQIVTWYDQTGNGKDVTRDASSDDYPKIATAGVIEEVNGLPAIFFGVVGQNVQETALARASESTSISGQTNGSNFVSIVFYQDSAKPRNGAWGHDFGGSGARYDIYLTYEDVIYYDSGNSSGLRQNVAQPSGFDDTQHVGHFMHDGATSSIYIGNTSLISSAKTGTVSHSTKKMTVGAAWGGASYAPNDSLRGYLQELIVWNRSHVSNRAALYTNQSNYWL